MSIQAVAWVLERSESRGLARLVLLSLANHVNDENICWPSQRTIADEAGIALGSVSKQIRRLVELGEIEVVFPGTHRRSARYRIKRSPHELSVHARSEQNHQEEEEGITNASSFGSHDERSVQFVDFHAGRAAQAVRERQRKGLPVLSPGGLAKTIQQDPDFIAESERLWEHRDCEECKGEGFVGEYSPGVGMVRVECSTQT